MELTLLAPASFAGRQPDAEDDEPDYAWLVLRSGESFVARWYAPDEAEASEAENGTEEDTR